MNPRTRKWPEKKPGPQISVSKVKITEGTGKALGEQLKKLTQ